MRHRWQHLDKYRSICRRCDTYALKRPHPHGQRWFTEWTLPDGTCVNNFDGQPTPACPGPRETMTVRVRDNAAEARWWGHGRGGPIIRAVTVGVYCQYPADDGNGVCGKRRGDVRNHNFCDDGEWASVDVWTNACGHIEMYELVLAEADRIAAAKKLRDGTEPDGRD